MAENETIAAILAAGMLSPVPPPASGPGGIIAGDEQTRFVLDVFHAVALYRAVLEALQQTGTRQLPTAAAKPAPANGSEPFIPRLVDR